jgi:uncharacterized protein YneF (UPF0154 family)
LEPSNTTTSFDSHFNCAESFGLLAVVVAIIAAVLSGTALSRKRLKTSLRSGRLPLRSGLRGFYSQGGAAAGELLVRQQFVDCAHLP